MPRRELKPNGPFEELIRYRAGARAIQALLAIQPSGRNATMTDFVDADDPYSKFDEETIDTKHRHNLSLKLLWLETGANFKKFKKNKSKNRKVWCTPMIDFIMWGKDEMYVKGALSSLDVQQIQMGDPQSKSKSHIILVGRSRTLELEATSSEASLTKEWVDAFNFLILWGKYEQERRLVLHARDAVKLEMEAWRKIHTATLIAGEIFKKQPEKNIFQAMSKPTVRRMWVDERMERITWSELEKRGSEKGSIMLVNQKSIDPKDPKTAPASQAAASPTAPQDKKDVPKNKGSLRLAQITQLIEEVKDEKKFIVVACKRSLELEAKSSEVRDKWVRALRFFVYLRRLEMDYGTC